MGHYNGIDLLFTDIELLRYLADLHSQTINRFCIISKKSLSLHKKESYSEAKALVPLRRFM